MCLCIVNVYSIMIDYICCIYTTPHTTYIYALIRLVIYVTANLALHTLS